MPEFEYRKSSYSDAEMECVEVATNIATTVAIRDSKSPTGSVILVQPTTWTHFRGALRSRGC